MNYKVAVYTSGQTEPSYNALVFATKEEAMAYGKNLWSRWTMCTRYEAEETSEPVNYAFNLDAGTYAPLKP